MGTVLDKRRMNRYPDKASILYEKADLYKLNKLSTAYYKLIYPGMIVELRILKF